MCAHMEKVEEEEAEEEKCISRVKFSYETRKTFNLYQFYIYTPSHTI